MPVLDVEGRRLGYRRAGSGEPLLLLHGGWSDSRDWTPQLSGLADTFDVIAWDAPGCGESDDPPPDVTLTYYADEVAALVRRLGLTRVHLCGLSFGGGLALAVYAHHPELVRSLVLAGAYAGWAGSLPPEEVQGRLSRILAETVRPPAEWVDDYLPGFFANPVPPETLQLVREVMLATRPTGAVPMLRAFAAADLRDVLPTVTVPTLVLHAEADVRAPRPVADALHAGIPGAELVVLPGVGHVSNLEAPDLFDDTVRAFLATVP